MRKNTKTQDRFEKEVIEKSGGKIKPLGEYSNNNTKTKFLCNQCGFIWDALPRTIICAGSGCPECAKKIKNSKIKLTDKEFTERLHAIHPEVDPVGGYVGNDTKMNFKCNVCGHEWEATPHAAKRKESGCVNCKSLNHMQNLFGENPKEFLYQRYVNEKATIRQLAVEIYGNVKCATSVNGWLKKFNIPLRHGSEAVKMQWIDNEERRELSRDLAKTHLLSEESVKKAREAQSTPEYREIASERKKGENNPMYGVIREDNVLWNPDITDEQRVAQRKTYLDARFKKGVKARDGNKCTICGESKGTIVAHHLMSYIEHPEFRYDIDNGVTLCEKCHVSFHQKYGWKKTTKEDFEEYLKTIS